MKLPVAEEAGDIVDARAASLPDFLRVLVIDDQVLIIDAMQRLFEQRGYSVFTAQSGLAGIQIFDRESPDLVICDLSMPFMTGWQVAKTIKNLCEERAAKKPLFLMLTGWGQEEVDEQRMIESGVDDFVHKPVNFKKLLLNIAELINKRGTYDRNFGNSKTILPQDRI